MATTPPLSMGEILDRTVQLYRRNFLLFVAVATLPAAIEVLYSGSISLFFTSRLGVFASQKGSAEQLTPQVLGFFLVLLLLFIVGLPLVVAGFSFGLGALNYTAHQRNQGFAVTVRAAYGYGARNFWRYLGVFSFQLLFAALIPGVGAGAVTIVVSLLVAIIAGSKVGTVVGVLIGLGTMLLALAAIVVAVWIWLRFSLAFPAALVEDARPWAAMKRSASLTKGSRGRIFVMYLLLYVLIVIAYYALSLPTAIILKLTFYRSMQAMEMLIHPPLLLTIVSLFLNFVERSMVMPIFAIALLLFYNDQRTRKEGYDIELLMAQAGWTNFQPLPVAIEAAPTMAIPAEPIPAESILAEPSQPEHPPA